MKEKTREELRGAAFEASFVVLGVILALAANEWREKRAGAERAEHAFASIVEELETNRQSIQVSHDYHLGLLAAIKQAVETSNPPALDTFAQGFVSAANVERTAWDSASATGAFEDIGFPKVLELSRVYAQQDRYQAQSRAMSPIIYEELYRGGTQRLLDNYRNLGSLIGSFYYRERELLALYDETFEVFGDTKGDPGEPGP